MALPSINEAIMELKDSNTDNRERLQKSLRAGLLNVVKAIEGMHNTVRTAFELDQKTADMQKLQNLKNAELIAELMRERESRGKDEASSGPKEGKTNWAGILLGITAFVSGLIAGFFEQFKKTWQILRALSVEKFTQFVNFVRESKLFKFLTDLWDDFRTSVITRFRNAVNLIKETNLFKSFSLIVDDIKMFGTNLFSRVKNFLKIDDVISGWKDEIKLWEPITDGIKSALKFITGPFLNIGNSLGEAKNAVIVIAETAIKPFVKAWEFIKNTFTSVMNTLKAFTGPGSALFTIGKVIGKIFYPITLLMSAIDVVTGAIEGYKEGGILGAIKGGLSGLYTGLIGAPLDLLKDAVSYILKFFGFDSASETLDSFSFSDLIKKMVGGIFDFITGTVNFVIDLFKDPGKALSNLVSNANDFLKKILRVILPVPDASDSWYSPKKLIKAAIPDSVYEYAGLDPKTGQMTEETAAQVALEESKKVPVSTAPSGGNAGAEVQTKTEERLNQSSAAPTVTNAPTMINSPSTVTQSSMTVVPVSARNSSPAPTMSMWTDPVMVGA